MATTVKGTSGTGCGNSFTLYVQRDVKWAYNVLFFFFFPRALLSV
jgi:hypothetical protein